MIEQSNYKNLIEEVVGNSTTFTWEEAKLEWYCSNSSLNQEGKCICGHPLRNLYYITNRLNKKVLIVGSTCVKKFDKADMTKYVEGVEKEVRVKKATAKKKLNEEAKYELLKKKQTENNIPLSIRKEFLEKRFKLGVINDFEFNFYNQIWSFEALSVKQTTLKSKINDKLLKGVIR